MPPLSILFYFFNLDIILFLGSTCHPNDHLCSATRFETHFPKSAFPSNLIAPSPDKHSIIYSLYLV